MSGSFGPKATTLASQSNAPSSDTVDEYKLLPSSPQDKRDCRADLDRISLSTYPPPTSARPRGGAATGSNGSLSRPVFARCGMAKRCRSARPGGGVRRANCPMDSLLTLLTAARAARAAVSGRVMPPSPPNKKNGRREDWRPLELRQERAPYSAATAPGLLGWVVQLA